MNNKKKNPSLIQSVQMKKIRESAAKPGMSPGQFAKQAVAKMLPVLEKKLTTPQDPRQRLLAIVKQGGAKTGADRRFLSAAGTVLVELGKGFLDQHYDIQIDEGHTSALVY